MAISRPVGITVVAALAIVAAIFVLVQISQALQGPKVSSQQAAPAAVQAQAPAAPAPAQPAQAQTSQAQTQAAAPGSYVLLKEEDAVPKTGQSMKVTVPQGMLVAVTGGPVTVQPAGLRFSGGKETGTVVILRPGEYDLTDLIILANYKGTWQVNGSPASDDDWEVLWGPILAQRINLMQRAPNCTVARGCQVVEWGVFENGRLVKKGQERMN